MFMFLHFFSVIGFIPNSGQILVIYSYINRLALKFAFPPLYISSSDFFQLLVSMKFDPIENTSDVNERDQCAENRHDQFQYMGANTKILREKKCRN